MSLSHIDPQVLWSLAGLFALLIVASLALAFLEFKNPKANYTELSQRIHSWWVMVVIFTAAMIMSRRISLAFFAFVSFLALKEYLSIIPTRRADRRVLFFTYLAIPIQYYWVMTGWYGMFIIFIPVYMFLFLHLCMVLVGETKSFLQAAGTLHWGLMTTVFSLSHASYLLVLPEAIGSPAGAAGVLLYLVVLTQLNDVAQFIWGKSLGRRKVVPTVSPNKTWEGLIGGVMTTSALAAGRYWPG